jgi:hypothetical protein
VIISTGRVGGELSHHYGKSGLVQVGFGVDSAPQELLLWYAAVLGDESKLEPELSDSGPPPPRPLPPRAGVIFLISISSLSLEGRG